MCFEGLCKSFGDVPAFRGVILHVFFFSSRRRHTRCSRDWSSDVCSSDLFMINDWPDEDRFLESFSKLIESTSKAAKAEHPRVAICGERVALLWAEGKKEAAIRLEQLCNDLAQTRKVDILCAYPSSLHIQEDQPSFEAICREHSAVHAR